MTVSRPVASQVACPVCKNVLSLSIGQANPSPPSSITEYWEAGYGMYTDAGATTPVTAEDQSVGAWVGKRLGTVLTGTNMKAKLIGGVFVPVGNGEGGSFALPGSFATNTRDFTFFMHNQRVGGMQGRGVFGLSGSGRHFECINYQDARLYTYDGVSNLLRNNMTILASPNTIVVRGSASTWKLAVNGVEDSQSAPSNRSMIGGKIFSLYDGSVPGTGRIWACGFGPLIDDLTKSELLTYCDAIRAKPSDSSPAINLAIYGDSNTEGTNANNVSWMLKFSDNDGARVLPIVGSGQYFGAGGNPANATKYTTGLGYNYKSGAAKNIAIVAFTNDFDSVSGTTHFNNVKTWGQLRQAEGWKVAVCKMPNRSAPFSGATNHNTQVATFNGLCVSDPWMDYSPDLATAINGGGYLASDGIHWNEAAQTVIYNAIKTAIGV